MGLAIAAAVKGYKAIFVMPDKMSDEKIRTLEAVGAKVVVCPTAVEPEDPRSYYSVSRRIADETPNSLYANQYHNPVNPDKAHYESRPARRSLGADRRARSTHLWRACGTGGGTDLGDGAVS